MTRRKKLTRLAREDFLAGLSVHGNVSKSARNIGLTRAAVYRYRDPDDPLYDEQFVADWDGALQEAADRLEQEAHRRAVDGVDEPVFYQGEQCGTIRRYSDALLTTLLKATRPEKYAVTTNKHEHTGAGGGPILTKQLSVTGVSPDDSPD